MVSSTSQPSSGTQELEMARLDNGLFLMFFLLLFGGVFALESGDKWSLRIVLGGCAMIGLASLGGLDNLAALWKNMELSLPFFGEAK